MRILLLLSLLLIKLNSYAETTNNLVSQDFTTGWSGTNLDHRHGDNIIAGVNGEYVESDAVSLNAIGINKGSLNGGFQVDGGSDIWFWNGYNQSVTQTIKTVDDNGNVLTQTRVIPLTSGSYQTYDDKLIVGQNSQQDYNVSLRFDFTVPNTTGHLGADLRNPFLNVTYTSQPDIEPEIIEQITQVEEEIKKDLKEVKIEDSKPVESMQETQVQSIDQTKEDKQEVQQTNAAPTSQSESPKEQQSQTEQKEKQTETESSQSTEKSENQNEASQETANANQTNVSSLDADMKEIDQNVKEIGQNIQMKNKVLHTRMVDNTLLDTYNNVRFYKDFKIYEDQVNIEDKRIIYSANLDNYKQKDPIFIKQKYLYEIKLQKLKLLNDIEVLKNG